MSKQPFGARIHYNIDLGKLCHSLGEDVVNILCQAMVGSDRLCGLQGLVVLNSKRDHASVRFEQALEAVLPMMWGTLCEISVAIRRLKAHNIGRRLKSPKARAAWKELTRIAHRSLAMTERFRNQMAFHFDGPTIATGLRELLKARQPVTAMTSENTSETNTGKTLFRVMLGNAVVIRGLSIQPEEFFKHVGEAKKDQEAVPGLLAIVVSDLFQGAGVQFVVVPQEATMRSYDDPE